MLIKKLSKINQKNKLNNTSMIKQLFLKKYLPKNHHLMIVSQHFNQVKPQNIRKCLPIIMIMLYLVNLPVLNLINQQNLVLYILIILIVIIQFGNHLMVDKIYLDYLLTKKTKNQIKVVEQIEIRNQNNLNNLDKMVFSIIMIVSLF